MRKKAIFVVSTVLVAVGLIMGVALTSDHSGVRGVSASFEPSGALYPSGTWSSGLQIQNMTGVTASVVVDFYRESGGSPAFSTGGSVAPNGSANFYLPALSGMASGRYSAVVSSDQQVASVANQTNYSGSGMGDSYLGISTGATEVNFPLAFRNYSSWNSFIAVQNTSGSTPANVWLNFYPTGQVTPALVKTATIPANSPAFFDVSTFDYSALGTFVGSVVVTSTQNVVAVIDETKQTGEVDLLAKFNAFSSSATSFVAPLVYKNYSPNDANGWTSGIQVLNKGVTTDIVTMVFRPTNAAGVYTSTLSIAGGSSGTFYMPGLIGIPSGLYGSATIQSTSNQIAVLVNTTKYASGLATGYNAFPAGSGTTRIVAPLVFKNYSPSDGTGWTSGIQVFNMGGATDTITMSFTGSDGSGPFVSTMDIGGAAAGTFYLPAISGIPAGKNGSAVITSVSQPIVAIVNTTKYASNIATAYPGINQ